ncbi:MAG: methyltransferase [Candidatus Omnitrophota bacterium]
MVIKFLFLQLKVLLFSVAGLIMTVIPGPDKTGRRRIKGMAGNIVSYAGIILFLMPWITITFLPQPRFAGILRAATLLIGFNFVILAVVLYLVALKFILPAFRKDFSEFTPQKLITAGPYKYVRNPIYAAVFIIILGLYLVTGAAFSILFVPLLYMFFKGIILYEEKMILEPNFKEDFIKYKHIVPASLLDFKGGIVIKLICVVLIALSLIHNSRVIIFNFIK